MEPFVWETPDELAEACRRIMNTEYSDKLDELYGLGGTQTTYVGLSNICYTDAR